MRFSYTWLSELAGFKGSAEGLAELLSLHAFETEVEKPAVFKNIIVAKVLKAEKHPNADRLRVVELTDGSGKIAPVVCGAWNFDAGSYVALALPGAVIPHDQHDPEGKPFTLSKATIRGIESQGMICSAKELGLGSEGSGILILDSSHKLGSEFSPKQSKAATFDVSVPANRPDLLSYRGVAREISVFSVTKLKIPTGKFNFKKLPSKVLKVRVSESKSCSKYSALRISDIHVESSPEFIQKRLIASGLRPINNVVDITNYVMLETGQPLHAFDAAKIAGSINVRKAYINEAIKTLDNVDRKLSADMLVIADNQKALAIAGVIGGTNSAVNESTTEIILEAANFNAVSIRKTAKFLGIRTDASSRFEKSLPVSFIDEALEYAASLLVQYAGAKPLEYAQSQTRPARQTIIKLIPANVNSLLGLNVSTTEQKNILTKFGFKVSGGKTFNVTVPDFRPDVSLWQDLAEEIARFIGHNKIMPKAPPMITSSYMTDPIVEARDKVSDLLAGMGYDEVYTYSFVAEEFMKKYGVDTKRAVEIANPLSMDQQYLRLGVGMNYEKIIAHNSKISPEGNYFEIGNVYSRQGEKIKEETNLFMVSYSKNKTAVAKLLGAWNELVRRLGVDSKILQKSETEGEIQINGTKIGSLIALVDEEVKWAALEVNFLTLIQLIQQRQYQPINKYPSKYLDVAILVKEELPWTQIKHEIEAQKIPLLADIEMLEVYHGKNLAPGKKSVAFRLTYQSSQRTLTDEEVEKIHSHLLETLRNKLGAQIRD